MVARLRKQRDVLLQTIGRLRSERGAAREERDQAVQEHDEAQQRIDSLQAKLRTTTTRRLEAEGIFAGLATELTEAKRNL